MPFAHVEKLRDEIQQHDGKIGNTKEELQKKIAAGEAAASKKPTDNKVEEVQDSKPTEKP